MKAQKSESFARWFGASKVASADGSPLVLYHGSIRWDDGERQIGNISVFDRLASHLIVRRPLGVDCVGVWLTSDAGPEGASMYSGGEGVIYPLYVRIERPWEPADFGVFLDQFHRAAGRDPRKQNPPGRGSPDALRQWLKVQGHDGIRFPRSKAAAALAAVQGAREALTLAEGEEDSAYRQWEAGTLSKAKRDAAARKRRVAAEELERITRANKRAMDEGSEFDTQDVWVALEPSQIKSAIGNCGAFDLNDPDITR